MTRKLGAGHLPITSSKPTSGPDRFRAGRQPPTVPEPSSVYDGLQALVSVLMICVSPDLAEVCFRRQTHRTLKGSGPHRSMLAETVFRIQAALSSFPRSQMQSASSKSEVGASYQFTETTAPNL